LQPNLDQAYLRWKYWEPRSDWEGPRSFVVTRGNDIVSHAGIVPGQCFWGQRRFRVIHPVDWAARPGQAGAGISVMKQITSLADVLLTIGGSEQTVRLLPHIGFRFAGTAIGYARPVRPLHLGGAPAGRWWRVPAKLGRRVFWMASAPRRAAAGWSVRPLGADDVQAVAPVLADCERGRLLACEAKEGIAVLARSTDALKFALRCPISPTRLFAAENDGRVLGYVVVSFAPGQARIADCWVGSDDANEWCAVIQCAVARARREYAVAEVVAWASDPMLQQALTMCGFHPRTREALQVRASAAFPAPPAGLRVQMIDSDLAYHHVGRAQLWT